MARAGVLTALASACLLSISGPVLAVSLGTPQARSAPGEALRLAIPLENLGGVLPAEIDVNLAWAEDHARLGVPYPGWGEQMRFYLIPDAQAGRATLYVTAPQTMYTQQVSFVLRLVWPGRLLLQPVTATLVDPVRAQPLATRPQPVLAPARVDAPAVAQTVVAPAPSATVSATLPAASTPVSTPAVTAATPAPTSSFVTPAATAPMLAEPALRPSVSTAVTQPAAPAPVAVPAPVPAPAVPAVAPATAPMPEQPVKPLPKAVEPEKVEAPRVPVPAAPVQLPRDPSLDRFSDLSQKRLAVRPGETLSGLAARWEESGLNLRQRQQLIVQSNPQAFIQGDINRLRADAVLTLPDLGRLPEPEPLTTAVDVPPAPPVESAETGPDSARLTLEAPGADAAQGGDGQSEGSGGSGGGITAALTEARNQRGERLRERDQLTRRLQELTTRAEEQDAHLQFLDQRLAQLNGTAPAPASSDAAEAPVTGSAESAPRREVWLAVAGGTVLALLAAWWRRRRSV